MTATLSPAEVISAAVTELYDQLREIVDRGPTDDPALLDKVRDLVQGRGSIGSRIVRARNRVRKAEEAAAEPKPAAKETTPDRPAKSPEPTKPPQQSVPSETPRRSVTLTIPRRKRPTPPELPKPASAKPASSAKPAAPRAVRAEFGGRRHDRLARWIAHVVIVLLMVGGTALAVATGTPWWGWLGVGLGAAAFSITNRVLIRRHRKHAR